MTPGPGREARAPHVAFWAAVQAHFGDRGTLDYDEFLALGIRCGLLREEPFDPDTPAHAALARAHDLVPGDPIVVPAPPPPPAAAPSDGERAARDARVIFDEVRREYMYREQTLAFVASRLLSLIRDVRAERMRPDAVPTPHPHKEA